MISVIIPTFKEKHEIATIPCLEQLKIPYELIIVNAKGVSKARNLGAKQASNDVLLFLEDDIQFNAKDLEEKVLKFSNILHKAFVTSGPDIVCCGRTLLIRKEDFFRVGGFDEHIVFGGEDMEFGVRALSYGLNRIYIPQYFTHLTQPDTTYKLTIRKFYETYAVLKHPIQFINELFHSTKKLNLVKFWISAPKTCFRHLNIVLFLVRIVAFYYFSFKLIWM